MSRKLYKSMLNKEVVIKGYTANEWLSDPKHLLFSLSRYKFISEMLNGKKDVLEIGAGDGFKSEIVRKNVKNLYLCEISHKINFKNFIYNDFTQTSIKNKKFDAIYLLDVFEHINKNKINKFIKNLQENLKKKGGVVIFGIPSLASQKYASKLSKKVHVNCLDKNEFKSFLLKYFSNVFMFSMNDEVLHTGFDKMSHYLFAICIK